METIRRLIEWTVLAIQLLAVVVIVVAILAGLWPQGLLRTRSAAERLDAFSSYKQRMGRGLLLALELLLAADIVGTVSFRPTLEGLSALGLLAVIRSFLSWSLDVEVEGCWPWRARAELRRLGGERRRATTELSAREQP